MCSISPAHFFARDGSLARKRASLSWEKRTRASLFLARPRRRSIGRAPRGAHSPARPPRARGALRARRRDFERARCPPFRPRRRRSLAPRARRFADSSSIVPVRKTWRERSERLSTSSPIDFGMGSAALPLGEGVEVVAAHSVAAAHPHAAAAHAVAAPVAPMATRCPTSRHIAPGRGAVKAGLLRLF